MTFDESTEAAGKYAQTEKLCCVNFLGMPRTMRPYDSITADSVAQCCKKNVKRVRTLDRIPSVLERNTVLVTLQTTTKVAAPVLGD